MPIDRASRFARSGTSWTLTPDTAVGFDLGQNVSFPLGETGDQENRAGQWFLKVRDPATGDVTDYPYAASDVFCTPTLLGP